MTAASMIAALALAQATAPASAPVPSLPPAVQLGTRYPVLTLAQALKDARLQNLDIQQAEARLQQARQLSWKAWSFYLPQITASGTYTRNNIGAAISLPTGYNVVDTGQLGPPPPQGTATTFVTGTPTGFQTAEIQTRDQLGAQAQVSQAILAPALWPAIANAYTAEKVVELNVENARREVLFGVAAAYYGAAGLKQAMEVTERQLVIAREHERDARVRYDAGTSPKVALLRAEIDRAQAEQDLKRAQNAFLQAKQALATALDRQPDFDVEPPPLRRSRRWRTPSRWRCGTGRTCWRRRRAWCWPRASGTPSTTSTRPASVPSRGTAGPTSPASPAPRPPGRSAWRSPGTSSTAG